VRVDEKSRPFSTSAISIQYMMVTVTVTEALVLRRY